MKIITTILLACVSMGAMADIGTPAEVKAESVFLDILNPMNDAIANTCPVEEEKALAESGFTIMDYKEFGYETPGEACVSLQKARAVYRLVTELGISRINARAIVSGNTDIYREEIVFLSNK